MNESFLVSPQQKALVLNPAEPGMLMNLLPMAKAFPFRGQTLYAVPHDIDVVRLLRNVGVKAPSPILHHYQWPCAFIDGPFDKQRQAAEFLTLHPRCFNLSQMGTGKTAATLWAFDYLRSIGKRKRMLVVAPLSTLERTWGDEIFKHFPRLTFNVLHGTKQRRLRLLAEKKDIYIINHDGVEVVLDALKKRDDIDVLAIDEIATYRNSKTDKYEAIETLCKPVERAVWGMTGTPTPNAPTDAWAQVKLVNPSNVPRFFGRFRDMTMNKINAFKFLPRADWLDTVHKAMQPSVRYTREELPITTTAQRHVELSPEQKKTFEAVRLQLKSEEEEGTVRAVNEADKLMKLVQVAAGAVYTTDGDTVLLDNKARVAEVLDIVEQSEGKVIVFVPFIAALNHVRDQIARRYPTELVYGATKRTDRDEAFWRFQNLPSSESRVLVANASVMSHGLTLTEASTIVWFAPTVSSDTFDQANHRIIRTGQERETFIIMIEGTAVERSIYSRLLDRQNSQGLLLEAISSGSI